MDRKFNFYTKQAAIIILLFFLTSLGIIFSMQHGEQKRPIENKKRSNTAEVKRLTKIADKYYLDLREFDTSYYFYKKIVSLCDPLVDTADYIDALTSIASIQQYRGDYIASEATVTEALPYLKYMKKPRFAWNVYNQLGVNYAETYDFDNAILFYKKSLHLNTSSWRKSQSINNIAVIYIEQKKYKEAAELFTILSSKNYFTRKKIENKFDANDYARILDNLGFCYFSLGDSKKALQYCFKGLKIRLKTQDHEGISTSYARLTRIYQQTNPKLAQQFAKKSYEEALVETNISRQINALQYLIKTSDEKDLKKHAIAYIKLIGDFNDTQKIGKNQFARIKYDSKNDKTENLSLRSQKTENELQLERQKKRNIILYIIITFALFGVCFLYFKLSKKGKKEKIEAIYDSESRISKKLHDELASDVYHTIAFAESKNLSLEENKEHLLKNLDTIYSRTRDISKENSSISTDKDYPLSLKEMISGFNTSNKNLLLNGFDTIIWDEIDKNKKIVIFRVLQELLVNTKKHSDASLVVITFKKDNKTILINYSDNGKGIDINKMALKNGLHNVESRIIAINGVINIDSKPDKGFKVFIKFPI